MQKQKMQDWPQTLDEARLIQERLKAQVLSKDSLGELEYVAGADVSYLPGTSRAKAAWAVLQLSDLKMVEQATAKASVSFPYVPGFLSFREIPPLMQAFSRLSLRPDLIVCDGQGIAHPRRFGLACHLGVLLDIPALGAAKSKLVGDYVLPDLKRGNWNPLVWQGEDVGAVLCTKTGIKPIFVSSGHRIGLERSMEIVLQLTGKYKLPETTRAAHALSRIRGRREIKK
ncbi:MAG: deoxyribonuclease V [Desulfohalobiaceae bacterium]